MTNDEFKDKVIDSLSRINEQLKHTINEFECEKKCNTLKDGQKKIYYVIIGIVGTIGFIAKMKGLI